MDDRSQRALEQLYQQTSKPTVPQRESMARSLDVSPRTVQMWFVDRRSRAKADKRIEELQARNALENAHQVPSEDVPSLPPSRPVNHRSQSAASYASLARSLQAAAACMPQADTGYDLSMPPSPMYEMGMNYPLCSPTESSFEGPSSMYRSDSQMSNYSMHGDFAAPGSFFPTYSEHSEYLPQATQPQIPVYVDRENRPRPGLHRTYTAPAAVSQRPIPRRTVSSTVIESQTSAADSVRIRRRPKLSPLGVGMARSRSSLGYDQSEFPYSAKRANVSDFSCPLTPIRRIPSASTVQTMGSMRADVPLSSGESSDSDAPASSTTDCFSRIQFPPSPISPDHPSAMMNGLKTVSALDLQRPITEHNFTPPPTPLTALNPSSENILAGLYEDTWTSAYKDVGLEIMTNDDPMLTEFLHQHDLALHAF